MNKYLYSIDKQDQYGEDKKRLSDGFSDELIDTFDIMKHLDQYISEINEFLFQRWWMFDEHKGIYHKAWAQNVGIGFRELSKPKKAISLMEIKDVADEVLGWCDKKSALPIMSKEVETYFVISGIQNMYHDKELLHTLKFVHQPSIRLNGDGVEAAGVSWRQGIATSFVNSTKYEINTNVRSYVKNLDDFFDFLSKVWLYVWNVSLKLKIGSGRWKNEQMCKLTTHVLYGDLHVWDIGMGEFKNKQGNIKSFLDLWFGLERIGFARNKIDNYFHQYLQNRNDLDRYSDAEIDTIKTICLMQSQNMYVLDKQEWAWLRYKKLLKKLLKDRNYYPLVRIFFEYRSNFIVFDKDVSSLYAEIADDMEIYC